MIGTLLPGSRGMIILKGAFFGALIGVLFAGNTLCALLILDDTRGIYYRTFKNWLFVLSMVAVFASPGALFLGALLTRQLSRAAGRFESRWGFLVLGMGAGLVLGTMDLLAIHLVMGGDTDMVGRFNDLDVFIAALAGGAGLGLGCALAIPFKKREPEANH